MFAMDGEISSVVWVAGLVDGWPITGTCTLRPDGTHGWSWPTAHGAAVEVLGAAPGIRGSGETEAFTMAATEARRRRRERHARITGQEPSYWDLDR